VLIAEPPAVISPVANVRPYPATTHSVALGLAWRSPCIDGSATLTTKKSSTIMNVPTSRTGSAVQRFERARPHQLPGIGAVPAVCKALGG